LSAPKVSIVIPSFEADYKPVYEPRSAVLNSHERGALCDLRLHYSGELIELYDTLPKTPNGY